MAARNKPFEQFGQYLLFKRLESDALGEQWRAGRIDGNKLGPTVALRRFVSGHREELASAAAAAAQIVPQLTGTSFARDQVVGVIDGIGYVAWDYAGGRSLRHVIDRARGSATITANPVPLDQAIVIAEKVALSLATTADLRDSRGQKLMHGALLPHFIWISDDGEIRVGGQQLGLGIHRSFIDARASSELGKYFSPEYRQSGEPTKASEVYALGAILYLLVTGQEPPDAITTSAFMQTVRAAKTMTGQPVPDDIRAILDKSLTLDPAQRYATVGEMKQAISALAHGGKYSATTFNLAFYLSNLLKKELEGEAIDREREAKVNLAPYLEAPAPAPLPAAVPVPTFGASEPKQKSKAPLFIAAALVLAAAGGGAWFMFGSKQAPTPKIAQASTIPAPQTPPSRVISEPVVASTSPLSPDAAATATTGSVDPAAQQKAFEEAVKHRMQAEMMKLQDEFTKKLQQEQSKNAPVQTAAAAPPMSAAQLDSQRRESAPPAAAVSQPQSVPTQTVASAPTQTATPLPTVQTPVTQSAAATQTTAPAPLVAAIREGDVVDVVALDTMPKPLRPIRPSYPPIAAKQKIEGSIVCTVLISETGAVLDVRVLRGKGFGLDDAAVRALRQTKFSPGIKDGKRVRTWYPQTIVFKL